MPSLSPSLSLSLSLSLSCLTPRCPRGCHWDSRAQLRHPFSRLAKSVRPAWSTSDDILRTASTQGNFTIAICYPPPSPVPNRDIFLIYIRSTWGDSNPFRLRGCRKTTSSRLSNTHIVNRLRGIIMMQILKGGYPPVRGDFPHRSSIVKWRSVCDSGGDITKGGKKERKKKSEKKMGLAGIKENIAWIMRISMAFSSGQ